MGRLTSAFLTRYRQYCWWVFLLLIIVTFFSYLLNLIQIKLFQADGWPYSVGDGLIAATHVRIAGVALVLPTVYVFSKWLERDFQVGRIIRSYSSQKLFFAEVKQGLIFSFCWALYFWATIFASYRPYASRLLNWQDPDSLFYFLAKDYSVLSFWKVSLLFVLNICLLLWFNYLLYIYCRWLSNLQMLGWLVIIFFMFWDWRILPEYGLLYRWFSLRYEWLSTFYKTFLFELLAFLILIGSSCLVGKMKKVRRRDYL